MIRLSIPIVLSCFAIVIAFAVSRDNHAYDRLSGKNGRLTVAHVYNEYKMPKGGIHYEYFYKVNGNMYFSNSSGGNVTSFFSDPIQCFIIAYDTTYPSLNTVLWNKKMDEFTPLGKSMPFFKNQDETIRKYTLSFGSSSSYASLNKREELELYKESLEKMESYLK